jgi:hypothetical protein
MRCWRYEMRRLDIMFHGWRFYCIQEVSGTPYLPVDFQMVSHDFSSDPTGNIWGKYCEQVTLRLFHLVIHLIISCHETNWLDRVSLNNPRRTVIRRKGERPSRDVGGSCSTLIIRFVFVLQFIVSKTTFWWTFEFFDTYHKILISLSNCNLNIEILNLCYHYFPKFSFNSWCSKWFFQISIPKSFPLYTACQNSLHFINTVLCWIIKRS